MSDGTDVRDRHGNQLRSMGPLGDEKDDIMSTKVEGAAKLPRIPLAGGLPRTPWRIEDRRPADFRDEPRLLVKVVKKGLRDGINSYVYAMDVLMVDELRKECVDVERNFGR